MPHDGQTQGPRGWPNILGLLRATNLMVLGKAGATAGAGLAGGTTSGAPTSGTFDVGEGVFGQDGSLWICTAAGSPGTFVQAGFANPLTTKADVLVGGAAGAASRLGVGSDNQVLTADSSQTLGLKWAVTAANAGGALTQIAQTTLVGTAASITFSSIPGTYTSLLLVGQFKSDSATDFIKLTMQLNGDTSAHYNRQNLQANNTSVAGGAVALGTSAALALIGSAADQANAAGMVHVTIAGYAGTTFRKSWVTLNEFSDADTVAGQIDAAWFGNWTQTSAITSILLAPSAGSFIAGTQVTLYGLS